MKSLCSLSPRRLLVLGVLLLALSAPLSLAVNLGTSEICPTDCPGKGGKPSKEDEEDDGGDGDDTEPNDCPEDKEAGSDDENSDSGDAESPGGSGDSPPDNDPDDEDNDGEDDEDEDGGCPDDGEDISCTMTPGEGGGGSGGTDGGTVNYSVVVGFVVPGEKPESFADLATVGTLEGSQGGQMRDFQDFFNRTYKLGTLNRIALRIESPQDGSISDLLDPAKLKIHSDASYETYMAADPANLFGPSALRLQQVLTETTICFIDLEAPDENDPEDTFAYVVRVYRRPLGTYLKDLNGWQRPSTPPIHQTRILGKLGDDEEGGPGKNATIECNGEEMEVPGTGAAGSGGGGGGSSNGGSGGAADIPGTGGSGTIVNIREIGNNLTERTYCSGALDRRTGELDPEMMVKEKLTTFLTRGPRKWDYTIRTTVSEASTAADGTCGPMVITQVVDETYQDFSSPDNPAGGAPGKKRLMSRTYDPEGDAITTTYTYYDAPDNRYLHGRRKTVEMMGGKWLRYEYATQPNSPVVVKTIYSPWQDVTLENYTQGKKVVQLFQRGTATFTTTVNGKLTKKTEKLIEVAEDGGKILTERKWSGTEWSTVITSYHPGQGGSRLADGTIPNPEAGRRRWKEHADGTATTWTYQSDGDTLLVTKQYGAGDRNGITDGTQTVTRYNDMNRVIDLRRTDIVTGQLISSRTAEIPDSVEDRLGRRSKWIYNDNPDDFAVYDRDCCGLRSIRRRDGSETFWYRDGLKRVYRRVDKVPGRPDLETSYAYIGWDKKVTRRYKDPEAEGGYSEPLFVRQTQRSLGGLSRSTWRPDADGDGETELYTRVRSYPEGGGSLVTRTRPDGTTTSTRYYLNSEVKSTTDEEGHTTLYTYTPHEERGGGVVHRRTYPGGTQWVERFRDALGRTFKTAYPDGAADEVQFYPCQTADPGSRGRLMSIADADEVASPGSGTFVSFSYSADGRDVTSRSALPDGQESTSEVAFDVVADVSLRSVSFGPSDRITTRVNGVVVSEVFQSQDGRLRGTRSFGRESLFEFDYLAAGDWNETVTDLDGSQVRSYYRGGLMAATLAYEAGASVPVNPPADLAALVEAPDGGNAVPADGVGFVAGSTASFDGFRRLATITNPRTGTTTLEDRLPSGAVQTIVAPGDSGGSRATSYTFDVRGRVLAVDLPDSLGPNEVVLSNVTHRSYTARGQLQAIWGDQTYPRFYQYDALGRMSKLHTWQQAPALSQTDTAPPAGSAVTEWRYHPSRGWLEEKNYQGESGFGPGQTKDYRYTKAGRLSRRTWERGVTTDYSYQHGLLSGVSYGNESNGHTTEDLAYRYDAFGRLAAVERGGDLHASYHYHPTKLYLTQEKLGQDTNFPWTLDRAYDALHRPAGVSDDGSYQTNYTYDAAGRLATVASAQAGTFTYRYLRGWGSLQHQVVGPAHTVTNEWEADRNVLAQKKNEVGAALISSVQYAVNDLGQRTSVSYGGSAFARPTAAETPHEATFTYNARGELIGRQLTNANAANLATEAYQFDAIGNRETSSEQAGTATAQTVSYQANALNQYEGLTDTTTPGGSTATLTHDADGNALSYLLPSSLIGDPPATLRWDAENRLVQIDDAFGNKINYDYDYLSRRTDKRVNDGQVRSTFYFYDGWNPLLIVEPSRSLHLTWGLDLSGSMQGAGGVGGLLAQTEDPGGTNASYYPTYDGNGNVSEYLDGTGTTAAHFEYDGFGKVTHTSGSPGAFPIRFSTKLEDAETGLNYYGYRFYTPAIGRWLSRDPIKERGHLYTKNSRSLKLSLDGLSHGGIVYANSSLFVGNDPLGVIDPNGEFGWAGAFVGAAVGAIVGGIATQSWEGAAAGAVGGLVAGLTLNAAAGAKASAAVAGALSGAAGGLAGGVTGEAINLAQGEGFNGGNVAESTAIGLVTGGMLGQAHLAVKGGGMKNLVEEAADEVNSAIMAQSINATSIGAHSILNAFQDVSPGDEDDHEDPYEDDYGEGGDKDGSAERCD